MQLLLDCKQKLLTGYRWFQSMGDIMCIVMGMESWSRCETNLFIYDIWQSIWSTYVKKLWDYWIYKHNLSKPFGASEFTYTIHWPDLGQVNLHIQFTGLIWGKWIYIYNSLAWFGASEFTYTIHWPDLGQVNLHVQLVSLWDSHILISLIQMSEVQKQLMVVDDFGQIGPWQE